MLTTLPLAHKTVIIMWGETSHGNFGLPDTPLPSYRLQEQGTTQQEACQDPRSQLQCPGSEIHLWGETSLEPTAPSLLPEELLYLKQLKQQGEHQTSKSPEEGRRWR